MKWNECAWVVYLVSLASPNDPDLEWKPRPQLVGSAEPFERPQAVPSDFLKHFFSWFFSVFLLLMFFRNSDSVFQYDEECTAKICQQTIQHLGISTCLFLTIRYRYWKVDCISILWIGTFDSWNPAPLHIGTLSIFIFVHIPASGFHPPIISHSRPYTICTALTCKVLFSSSRLKATWPSVRSNKNIASYGGGIWR